MKLFMDRFRTRQQRLGAVAGALIGALIGASLSSPTIAYVLLSFLAAVIAFVISVGGVMAMMIWIENGADE